MTLSTTLLIAAVTPALLFVFWTLSATNSSPFTRGFPTLYNKRICLLIAHPDDEAMFFAPTLLALTKPELGNHVKILCLSTGDADGLGHVRQKELKKSAVQLGLRDESDVFTIDDPSNFPDSMTATWPASGISSLLASAFAPKLSSANASSTSSSSQTPANRKRANGSVASDAPHATIDVLLTFDNSGVSNHPNHRSLYHGARAFLEALMKGKSGYTCPVSLYTLTSTNMLRKYVGVLDAPLTMFYAVFAEMFGQSKQRQTAKADTTQSRNRLVYVSGLGDWLSAWNAMVRGHQSQMVWFRWGWITVGRYMVVNDLKRESV